MNFVRVDDFPNYVIHPIGTVLRICKSKNKTKEMKHTKKKDGYIQISLSNNGKQKHFRVHRLLALHFIPNPENKPCIDHIDAVRDNNSLSNLEWVTIAENNRRRSLNHPVDIITKGCISKRKNGYQWEYCMKGKRKSKQMKSKQSLEKFRDETLKKYLI